MNQLNQKVVKATLFGLASGVFLLAGSLTAVAGEVKYKHQLPITLSDGSQVMTYRETEYRNLAIREWAIVKVQDNKTFSVYHTTQRSRGVFQKWFDHPVKAMKVCLTNGFELSNCEVIESDTASIPEGKTIHNLSIEIIYSENGSDQRNTFNIPTEAKPE